MRRTMTLLALLAFVPGAAYADRAQPDSTKTHFATLLPTAPEIDGVINTEEWSGANGATGNWRMAYDANQPNMLRGGTMLFGPDVIDVTDIGAQVYAGYNATDLFIAVRVTDNYLLDDSAAADSANGRPEEDDSVELYIDALNGNADAYATGTPGGRYAISLNNAYAGSQSAHYGAGNAWYARVTRSAADTGYDVEFRISLKSLSDPQFGDVLGFTVVVNDDKSGGTVDKTVDRQIAWVGTPGKPVTYGNLILGNKTYHAPLVTQAPAVDGRINSAEYDAAMTMPINPSTGQAQTSAGVDTWPAGTFEASAWVVHDSAAVYVAVDVTDTQVVTDTAESGSEDGTTWEDDSVEVFFDADLGKNRGGPTLDYEGQYVLTANGAHRDNEARNPTFGEEGDWFAATTATAKGYQIEFKVKKSALLNPTNGMVMGFNIALNNDNGAGRAAQLSWNGDPHQEYTYGQLTLAAAAAQPPVLKIAKNANGSITISWQSNAAFVLEIKQRLSDPAWTTISGTSGNSVTLMPGTSTAFYRLRQ